MPGWDNESGPSRVAISVNGTVSYLLTDQLGSTSITTDASGAKTAEVRYKAWGEAGGTVKPVLAIAVTGCALLMLVSCRIDRTSSKSLVSGVGADEVNTRVRLETWDRSAQIRMSNLPYLDLENYGKEPVIFPSDFGLRILIKDGDVWRPLTNNFGYPPHDNIVPPRAEDPLGGAFVSFYPDPGQLVEPRTVRIIVVGVVSPGGQPSTLKTAAYIDLLLLP